MGLRRKLPPVIHLQKVLTNIHTQYYYRINVRCCTKTDCLAFLFSGCHPRDPHDKSARGTNHPRVLRAIYTIRFPGTFFVVETKSSVTQNFELELHVWLHNFAICCKVACTAKPISESIFQLSRVNYYHMKQRSWERKTKSKKYYLLQEYICIKRWVSWDCFVQTSSQLRLFQ